jgi:hypothetical protein
MRRLSAALIILLGLANAALAQGMGNSPIVPATQKSIAVTITTATTTKLITELSNQSIYVTAVDIIATGTGNIQFIAGTGATCGTGTVNITGNYALTAQVGFTKGTGNGVVWVVPPGLALCAVTSNAVGYPGSIAYAQF